MLLPLNPTSEFFSVSGSFSGQKFSEISDTFRPLLPEKREGVDKQPRLPNNGGTHLI